MVYCHQNNKLKGTKIIACMLIFCRFLESIVDIQTGDLSKCILSQGLVYISSEASHCQVFSLGRVEERGAWGSHRKGDIVSAVINFDRSVKTALAPRQGRPAQASGP